tara:strand:- start:83 stop:694 length:612 start_codon:yes stop_codon:yes gene_type:complete
MILIIFSLIFLYPVQSILASEKESCNYFTEKYGKEYRLPNGLLTSISLVESGIQKKEKGFQSWPWTLNVSGKSKYFDNKQEVLDYLRLNLKKNKSIDVGCMQINTKYHLKKFNDLDHIIDPKENVKYAAEFLSRLYKKHRSWNEAISRYHSSIPKKKKLYLKKVYSFWNNLRQKKIIIHSKYINNHESKKIKYFREILAKENI